MSQVDYVTNVRSSSSDLEKHEKSTTIDTSETDFVIPPLSSELLDFHYREQFQEELSKEKDISYVITPSNNQQTIMTSMESSFHIPKISVPSLQEDSDARTLEIQVSSIIGFQMMDKIDRPTRFDRIRVEANTPYRGDFDYIEIGNFRSDFLDVNEVRRKISKRFLKAIQQVTPEQQKLIRKEMENFIDFVEKAVPDETFRHGNPDWGKKYFQKHGAPTKEVKKVVKFFFTLITFDFFLQYHCYNFAMNVLNVCNCLVLTWHELTVLLEIAIANIEQLHCIFTQRMRIPVVFGNGSRDEWCQGFHLIFRKDLSEFQSEHGNNIAKFLSSKSNEHVIDIEDIRRVLYEKKESVRRFAATETPKTPNFMELLRTNLSNSTDLEAQFVPSFEGNFHSKMSEGIREFTRKTLKQEEKTPFVGYVFFVNSLPGCRLNFELWNEDNAHYSEFCRCDRVGALEMLDVHTLFERSFRLMHFWDKQLAHLDTHLYLINELLQDLDTKRDPSIGFFFVLVDEEPEEDDDAYLFSPYRQFFPCHAENEEEIRRSGLFMGLLPPNENSFFTEDFHLESISVSCQVTCRGLVYIALNDLRKFLEQMAKRMRCWNEEYPIEEDEELERHWMKEMIANFWIELKKELIPINPYQKPVFQEDSPFRSSFKPLQKKDQINESTECLELLFGN